MWILRRDVYGEFHELSLRGCRNSPTRERNDSCGHGRPYPPGEDGRADHQQRQGGDRERAARGNEQAQLAVRKQRFDESSDGGIVVDIDGGHQIEAVGQAGGPSAPLDADLPGGLLADILGVEGEGHLEHAAGIATQ